MSGVIENFGNDTPTERRGNWIVTIDGHGDLPGVPRGLYRFVCPMMTPAAAIEASIAKWQQAHCPDPDEEGDIMSSWTIYGVTAEPVDHMLVPI